MRSLNEVTLSRNRVGRSVTRLKAQGAISFYVSYVCARILCICGSVSSGLGKTSLERIQESSRVHEETTAAEVKSAAGFQASRRGYFGVGAGIEESSCKRSSSTLA